MKVSIREDRPNRFQVYFSYEGKQIHLFKWMDGKTPLHSKGLAQSVKSHIERWGYDPAQFGRGTSFSFDKAVETWIKLSTCSEEWLLQRKEISKRFFLPYFKKSDIRKIKTIHINEFYASLKAKGYGDKTLYNYMSELRTFFRFHRKSLPELPEFPRITYQEAEIKFLSREEQDKVFAYITDEQDLKIFTFMRQYGCRENEASGLLKQNVFLDHDPPYFIVATVLGAARGQVKASTKTKRLKVLPILPEIRWIFESEDGTPFIFSKNGKPYTNRRLVRIWNRANKESGVQTVNLYNAMRHSFATQRLNEGYSIDGIQKTLGHTNVKTTQRYLKYHLKTLEDVIRGKVTHMILLPSKTLQLSEKILVTELGGKDSNLG